MTRQQSIPGTDVDHPEIRDCIERWLEACERAKRAAEKKQELDDAIVVTMLRLVVAYHPYTDPETGKRKYRVVDTTPRGKSISARPMPPEDLHADEPEESESTPVEGAVQRLRDAIPAGTTVTVSVGGRSATLGSKAKADKSEHRKVSRSKAQREIQERDAETRARDAADDPLAQGAAAVDGALRPARDWDAEA